MGIPGNGEYRLQPIHVEDLAALAVREAMAEAASPAESGAGRE